MVLCAIFMENFFIFFFKFNKWNFTFFKPFAHFPGVIKFLINGTAFFECSWFIFRADLIIENLFFCLKINLFVLMLMILIKHLCLKQGTILNVLVNFRLDLVRYYLFMVDLWPILTFLLHHHRRYCCSW